MDELMAQFIVEARELVQAAIDDLFVLAAEPGNAERVNSAFRSVHTLKGSVALFDMAPLQSVLHRAETNLDRVRSGARAIDREQIDALVAVLEWIDACVDDVERQQFIGPDLLESARRFDAALDPDAGGDRSAENDDAEASAAWARALASSVDVACTVALRYTPHPECYFSGDDPVAVLSRVPQLTYLSFSPRDPWPSPDRYDPFRANLVFEALSAAPPSDVAAVFQLVPDQVEIVPIGASRQPSAVDADPDTPRGDGARSLRIDSARLDALLLTVGELMTIKNGFGELAAGARALQGGGELARAIAATQKQLDQVVGTLYGDVLQTRMVPVAQAFRRLPRVVHDLARRLDKPADLVIVGDDIGADKTIVDQLFEPMLHIVRNAMDHGVETPAERSACGKPAKAKLLLEVARQGEQIVLRFSDDGRGIDPATLRAAAVRRNVVSAEQASRLDDRAALELLFHAGFSTAAEVSDLSGRGVGLDVVRAEVNRLGGTVEIGSRIGRGTEVAMRLPLSFAMTQLLVLSVAGERYGVPLADVAETVRLNRKDILPVRENQAFLLRDRVVPLLSLVSLLGLPENRVAAPDVTVLVLALGQGRVGVTVDAIAERVEMVTKPLEGLLSGAPGIAGTTVLGDGQVLLVLDMAELIQ